MGADNATVGPLLRLAQVRWYRATAVAAAAIAALGLLLLTGGLTPAAGFLIAVAILLAGWIGGIVANRLMPPAFLADDAAHAKAGGIQSLISALPDPAIVLAPDGRVLNFNAEALAIAPAFMSSC